MLPSWSFTVKGEKQTVSERSQRLVSIMSDTNWVVKIYCWGKEGQAEATLDTIGLSEDAMFEQGTSVQRLGIGGSKCLDQQDE